MSNLYLLDVHRYIVTATKTKGNNQQTTHRFISKWNEKVSLNLFPIGKISNTTKDSNFLK